MRKLTYFQLNRMYLLSGLIFSFFIPGLKFSILKVPPDSMLSNIAEITVYEPDFQLFTTINSSNGFNINKFLQAIALVYFSGITILFFRHLFSIIRIIRLMHCSEKTYFGKLKIIKTNTPVPFTFFNKIFLPKNLDSQMIIEHEAAHIIQFHWFDLILAEIATILLWFNPFVVLYKRSLRLQHEYLADSYVVRDGTRIENYLGNMLKQVYDVSTGGLFSYFYCKTIKKRIVMITKNKTSVKFKGIYLLVLPLIIGLLMAFSFSTDKNNLKLPDVPEINPQEYVPSIFPVDINKVTTVNGYGDRIHPFTKKHVFHYAIDFALEEGENIYSTATGMVIEASFDSQRGNYIFIRHNDEYSTFYSHLKEILVKPGDKVQKGGLIGYVGNTGYSTGSHLHYEVHKNGEKINPKDYLPK
ncbi:MAG: M23/M56 family metallopeptidase [Bacteroidales bacterium]